MTTLYFLFLHYLTEGDLYEDGLAMKNGFFRTRNFNRNGSEAGSLDLFGDDHHSDGEGATGLDGGERVEFSSQAEAKRRKDRLEREEFIRKFRVHNTCMFVTSCMCVCVCVCVCVHVTSHNIEKHTEIRQPSFIKCHSFSTLCDVHLLEHVTFRYPVLLFTV